MEYREEKVLYNKEICNGIWELKLSGKFQGRPGQFYMLRAWENEPLLSRPISIYSIDEEGISFLYKIVGKGTEILKKLQKGDEVKVTGPLGNGFPMEKIKGKVAIVVGGIGIAPMRYLTQGLEGCEVHLYAGFRDESYSVDSFSPYIKKSVIVTETGEEGEKGYVTDYIDVEDYNVVLSCGPEIMMNKLIKQCKEKSIPLYVSLEKHMACGVGACLVCTCKTKDGYKRTCKEGPVFLGEELEE
ncbi:dihydroorotate dehydrogenase electron transfer subunit [Clostridium sp. MSJ-11]|uniref:Dihydroorotate dehydrogenase B (NAD(+)), electron transfer subunit n=1 Tax=Clostridium mobile TaxID=2841512 RepID=A0ABS6EJJ2_9CLOT|nr:dihydroorotate dehydrogenase electron transfer subunit [Clostridium mobile]MBU5485385.1 dihydroorotate dehydrogenase electron transfer subunit [Clostridium mobile]